MCKYNGGGGWRASLEFIIREDGHVSLELLQCQHPRGLQLLTARGTAVIKQDDVLAN